MPKYAGHASSFITRENNLSSIALVRDISCASLDIQYLVPLVLPFKLVQKTCTKHYDYATAWKAA